MKKTPLLAFALLSGVLVITGGCVSTVKTVVTAPFKVAGKAVDWTTTSQDESDRNRGRRDRKAEKRDKKEERARQKQEQRNGGSTD